MCCLQQSIIINTYFIFHQAGVDKPVTWLQDTYISTRSLVDLLQPAAFSSPPQRCRTELIHFKPASRYLWKATTELRSALATFILLLYCHWQ